MENRVVQLRKIMRQEGVEAALITSSYNRYYLSSFTGTTGTLFITESKKYMLTDFRYLQQVAKQCEEYEIIDVTGIGYVRAINDLLEKHDVKTIGFEGQDMSYSQYNLYSSNCNRAKWKSISTEELRILKDEKEVEYIIKAAQIAEEAFDYVLKNVLKPGVKEIEVCNALESKMKELGASGPSFTTIIASGERGALPHGVASEKIINEGEFVTFDFGALYKGYCSDITRTVAVGKLPNEKLQKIYQIVLDAQIKGINAIKDGISAAEVDKIVRDHIIKEGYGKEFGHSTGHGVGIEIHESPRLMQPSNAILKAGMVVTVEPGIYIPGLGGVRIEDDVLVTEDGYKVLTSYPKQLSVIKK